MVRFVSFWDEKLLFIDVFFYILLAVHVSGALFIARTLNIQTWEHVRGRSKLHLENTKSEEKKNPTPAAAPDQNEIPKSLCQQANNANPSQSVVRLSSLGQTNKPEHIPTPFALSHATSA
jgi:hypothetical protein